jgi:hypothetical protein
MCGVGSKGSVGFEMVTTGGLFEAWRVRLTLAKLTFPDGNAAFTTTSLAPTARGTPLMEKEPVPSTVAGRLLTHTGELEGDTVPFTSVTGVVIWAPAAGCEMTI